MRFHCGLWMLSTYEIDLRTLASPPYLRHEPPALYESHSKIMNLNYFFILFQCNLNSFNTIQNLLNNKNI